MNEQTYEYATVVRARRPGAGRRTWLVLTPTLAALLVLLIVAVAACRDRSDDPAGSLGPAGTPSSPEASASPATPEPETGGTGGVGPAGSGNGDGGGSSGGGDSGGGGGPEEPEPEAPTGPLSVQVSLNTVAPAGQCFASGTITVEGGEYPVTVSYQFRRVALVDGQLGTEAVTPVLHVTFDEPGSRQVQTNNLPTDGPNVRIFVTGPQETESAWEAYESCQPGLDEIGA